MILQGERTDITYDDQRRIIQLDTYLPDLAKGEVGISIDFQEFTRMHPLRGGVMICQELEDDEDAEHAYVVPKIYRDNDPITYEDGLEISDIAASDDILQINQYVGKLGQDAVAIAIATHDFAKAESYVPQVIELSNRAVALLDEYSARVN